MYLHCKNRNKQKKENKHADTHKQTNPQTKLNQTKPKNTEGKTYFSKAHKYVKKRK